MVHASITCSDLSFSWPDGTSVLDGVACSVGPGRTGLVAPNGAGKTTLLRLVAGDLTPTRGSVTVRGALRWLQQDLPFDGARTVAEVLGIAPILHALDRLAAGDADADVLDAIGDGWDVEERARMQLERLGLGGVGLDRRLATLSGGEVVSLGLAAQLLARPDVLLLDEPTNNLDAPARTRLIAVVEEWRGCLLVVSHDRGLLDRVDRVAELHRGAVRLHGGGFSAYEEAVRAEQAVAERRVRGARQEVRREQREQQRARERAARRAGSAARGVADAGLPRIVAGGLQRRAQESAGRADTTHGARLDAARARLDEADRAVRDEDVLALELPATAVPSGRMVLRCTGLQAHREGGPVFARSGVDLVVRGPERIALTGPNGAGKTTLLRLVEGVLEPSGGTVRRLDGRIAALSQRLDLLDPSRSVLESLEREAPGLDRSARMHLLARFLFRGERVHLPVGALSGGERLRATLACVLFAEPVPQVLLLDEPTNNLDLASVAQLEAALRAYRGALLVVSHDARFLTALGLTRWLHLEQGRLAEVAGPDGP